MKKIAVVYDKIKSEFLDNWPSVSIHDHDYNKKIAKIAPDYLIADNVFLFDKPDCKSVYYHSGYENVLSENICRMAKTHTAVFLTNKDSIWNYCLKKYNSKIFFVSGGADPEIFKPVKVDKKYDIIIDADYLDNKPCDTTPRWTVYKHILEKWHSVMIIGKNWPKWVNAQPRGDFSSYNKILNTAKIVVHLPDFTNVSFFSSNRLFQIMSTGAAGISWYVPDTAKLFRSGYLDAGDLNELDELIDYFLANEHARIATIGKQRKEIITSHTVLSVRQRMENLLQYI